MTDEHGTRQERIGNRLREAMRESEIRLRTVVESLPFDFFLIGPDGRYVMQNSASRRNWGEAVGKRPEDLCSDAPTLAVWQSNNRRAFAGEVVRGEVAFESPMGAQYCYNIVSPIRDGDAIRGILGVNIDITARKQAEQALQKLNDELEERVQQRTTQLEASNRRLEAEVERRQRVEAKLRESETQYRTLVESARESIIQVDGEGRLLFLNWTAAQFLEGTPEQFVGKSPRDFFPADTAERQIRDVRAVMETGRSITTEFPVSLHGQTTWFSATFEPLTDATGKISSVLVVARNIQELRQARKELQAYQDHMARMERLASLGTLSAMVAHEMNQPLTVLRLTIQDCLAQLRSQGLSDEVLEDLESCIEEVSTAAAIINRFRGFAKEWSKGKTVYVDLRGVATRVLRLWEEPAREVRMTLSLAGLDALPRICADENDVEQLFFSLVENAVQAADGQKERRLTVRGAVKSRVIELAFADDCGGIAPEHASRVFEPFFTTKGDAHATGLGLCIVERSVRRIGGKIAVENRPGVGVTFVVTLPVAGDT